MHDVYKREPHAFHYTSMVSSDERFQEHVFVYAFRQNTYLDTRKGIPHLAVIFAVRILSERHVACHPDHVLPTIGAPSPRVTRHSRSSRGRNGDLLGGANRRDLWGSITVASAISDETSIIKKRANW
jgi:hypothetical protein